MVVVVAFERVAERISVECLIGEVFERVRILHTFAATSGPHMRAMDLFGNTLVFVFGYETRF
jgi:hypothetical protein